MKRAQNDRHPTRYAVRGTRHPRAGFTLVELLVVIAIIAILFSLTSAAVVKVLGAADETANRTEISKLEVAMKAFQESFSLTRPPPSRIRLRETIAAYNPPADALDTESLTFLKSMWPNLGATVDWDGNGAIAAATAAPVVLEGDQCLVFWLGGIPATNGVATTGFSVNKRDPSWHVRNGGDVVQPFYEFNNPARLFRRPSTNRFFSYLDLYGRADGNGMVLKGQPYAYFSSYQAGNDYRDIDCAGLRVIPYRQPIAQITYHNRTGYQIISAGLDGKFGPGGPWSPSTASGTAADGRDDQANFYDRKLGISQ